MSEKKRIVFYSTSDMSAGWNLEKAEKILETIDINSDFSLADYMEFYNINQYFENEIFLKKWSEEDKDKYKDISKRLFKKTMEFARGINEENILEYIHELKDVYYYQDSFWEMVSKSKVYENISSLKFTEIITSYPYCINFVLKYKNIVNFFDQETRTFLIGYGNAGEILLNHIKSTEKEGRRCFPSSLTNEDKENIILKYIEKQSEGFGDLELISRLGDSAFLKLSSKTKLKAKQTHEKRNQEFFENNNNTLKFGFQVILSKDQKEEVKVTETTEGLPSFSYSVDFFNKIDFQGNPLGIFISLFGYTNNKGLIELVSKDPEIGIMEGLFSHRNQNDYKVSISFKNKEIFALLNLQILSTYLKNFKSSCLEDILNNYISNFLVQVSNLGNLQFQINNYDIPYQEKITNLIPKLDSFIKQYRCYVEENKIDFSLIDIDSRPVSYETIPSLLPDKYFYEVDNKLAELKFYFYSDQSGLFYIDGFENKYHSFYDLLKNESLKLENFHDYQQKNINHLIKEGNLYLDKDEYIRIKDEIFIYLVGEIYREGVLSYYSYKENMKSKIIETIDKGLLLSESTLLSKQESDYFNYYLNKSKFSNGPDIRNKNIHGHKYSSDNEAYTDYLTLLRMIVLILLKIDLELKIKLGINI